jgi:hypothetical protein
MFVDVGGFELKLDRITFVYEFVFISLIDEEDYF